MTVEEMVAKVEADLEQWLSQIGCVICATKKGMTLLDAQRACAITSLLAGKMIVDRNWKEQALQVTRDIQAIPVSCTSIEAMCHAMAHCLADYCNRYIEPPGNLKFDCSCFCFYPPPPPGWTPGDEVPIHERIKFSHN